MNEEIEKEPTKEEVAKLSAIEMLNKFIFKDVNKLTQRPRQRLLRSEEDVEERKTAAQIKRDRKNAKRLK